MSSREKIFNEKRAHPSCNYLLVRKCQLETGFGGINTDDPRPGFPIKTEQLVFNNPGCVDGIVQCTNSACITSG